MGSPFYHCGAKNGKEKETTNGKSLFNFSQAVCSKEQGILSLLNSNKLENGT